MSELENILVDDIKDANTYCEMVWKGGLYKFPPAIVTCAITGGNNGKESNPNLPETVEEQVQSAYEAYKAGAVMVHIHCRNPENTSQMTYDPEIYREVNIKIREKCPDLIINNTNIFGRDVSLFEDGSGGKVGPQLTSISEACAEVGSVDVSNYFSSIPMAPRPPEHPEPWTFNRGYCISQEDALNATKMMAAKGIKPEFECFQMSDMHYVRWLVNHGFVDPFGGRNWIQFVYTMGSNWNTPEFMSLLKQVCPRNSVLGIIATGPQQWPVLAQALIHGLHVRVGMEDNVYYAKGQKAESNAQLVEKICRIADDLGRRRATCEEARQILGLGAPRTWK